MGVIRIGDILQPDGAAMSQGRPGTDLAVGSDAAPLTMQTDLRTALSQMLAAGSRELNVVSDGGSSIGTLTLEQLLQAARTPTKEGRASEP